jgi:altronate dehydratase large subunit
MGVEMETKGYIRSDGSLGYRNHIVILPSVGCANDVALRIGRMYPNVLVLTHRQGCESITAEYLANEISQAKKMVENLYRLVNECEERVRASGMDIRGANPAPGNIAGEITTIEENSLGGIKKGGGTSLQGVLRYGDLPTGKGWPGPNSASPDRPQCHWGSGHHFLQ